MKLGDIKIVDLKNSIVDEKLSKPKECDFVFKLKRYVSYKGTSGRPDVWFRWIRHEKNTDYREEREARVEGYSYVQHGVDPYWPESVPPDGEGHFVYGDVVLMKRPLIKELDARLENARLSKGMAQAKINAFKSQLREENAGIPQGLIDEMI
jgi:hypothetical protein